MRLRNLLALSTLIALPAMAQDARFGLQAGLSLPQGDAKTYVDSHTGYTLGLYFFCPIDGGHSLRPRLDYSSVSGSIAVPGGSSDTKVTTTDAGLDYLYNFSGKAGVGPYLALGLGYANTKVTTSLAIPSLGAGAGNDQKGTFMWGLGGGWNFTPLLGAELRYTSTSPDFGGGSVKNNAISLSATFTF